MSSYKHLTLAPEPIFIGSVRGFAPRNPVHQEATAVRPWSFTFLFLVIIFGIGLGLLRAPAVQAKIVLKYPIPELGNCQNKNACKQYCDVSSHYLVCTDFGEKNNLITKAEAARAKKFIDVLKGKGPGGCKNETTCKNYCNKIENQKVCFIFAKKNGLISAEKLKEINEGIDKLRSGLKQMPPEMKNCIIKKVGAGAVNKIEVGQGEAIDLVEIGSVIQNCAISFGGALQQKAEEDLKQAPPAVQGCVKSIIGNTSGKIKGGEFKGQSDIISAILQNCLPPGTKIPSGGGINMGSLKYIEEYYGKSLSPKDLESLKKAQEQLKGIIPQGTEIPSDKKTLNLEDVKNIQEKMQEDLQTQYNKMTPEEREWIKKTQEQGQYENISPPEIPKDSSGMGM